MKKITFFAFTALFSSVSLFAQTTPCETGPGNNCVGGAIYECEASVRENVKVMFIEHKEVDEIDYNRPIDPSLIISQTIINKEGLSGNVADYLYSAMSRGEGVTRVLYTRDVETKLPKFRFSTDLSLAEKNPNPGHEWDYYLAMYDEKGNRLAFGTNDHIKIVERTGPRPMMFKLFNLARYDARKDTFFLSTNLSKMLMMDTLTNFEATSFFNFKKNTPYVGGEVWVATGYHNEEDLDDISLGTSKSDSAIIDCRKI